MVDLMIILFHLKLYKFYCIGVMMFIWWCYYCFHRKELLQKAKDRYHNGGGKEKAAEYYFKNKGVWKENANIRIETF